MFSKLDVMSLLYISRYEMMIYLMMINYLPH